MSAAKHDHITELEESIRDMAFLAQMLIQLGIAGDSAHEHIYYYAGIRLSEHSDRAQDAFQGLHAERCAARHPAAWVGLSSRTSPASVGLFFDERSQSARASEARRLLCV